MINIRKLAAVDMVWLGARVIIAEYFLGIVIPLILGWISIRAGLSQPVPMVWETALGFWLVSIGVNYIPLFIYAVLISRAGTVITWKKRGFTIRPTLAVCPLKFSSITSLDT